MVCRMHVPATPLRRPPPLKRSGMLMSGKQDAFLRTLAELLKQKASSFSVTWARLYTTSRQMLPATLRKWKIAAALVSSFLRKIKSTTNPLGRSEKCLNFAPPLHPAYIYINIYYTKLLCIIWVEMETPHDSFYVASAPDFKRNKFFTRVTLCGRRSESGRMQCGAYDDIIFLLLTAERFARECAELNGTLFSKQGALKDAYFFIGLFQHQEGEEEKKEWLSCGLPANRFAWRTNVIKGPHANIVSDPFEKVEMAHAYRLTLDSKCQRVKENGISNLNFIRSWPAYSLVWRVWKVEKATSKRIEVT